MRTTKIVATIGPATNTRETLSSIVDQGVDVIRFNMSHGSHDQHKRAADLLTDMATERGTQESVQAEALGGRHPDQQKSDQRLQIIVIVKPILIPINDSSEFHAHTPSTKFNDKRAIMVLIIAVVFCSVGLVNWV